MADRHVAADDRGVHPVTDVHTHYVPHGWPPLPGDGRTDPRCGSTDRPRRRSCWASGCSAASPTTRGTPTSGSPRWTAAASTGRCSPPPRCSSPTTSPRVRPPRPPPSSTTSRSTSPHRPRPARPLLPGAAAGHRRRLPRARPGPRRGPPRRRDRQPRRRPRPRRRGRRHVPAALRRPRRPGVRAPLGHARHARAPAAGWRSGSPACPPRPTCRSSRWSSAACSTRSTPRCGSASRTAAARSRSGSGGVENAWHGRHDVVGTSAQPPREYVGRFSVDSAVFDASALRLLVDTLGADHVLLGSDYPYPLGEAEAGRLIRTSPLLDRRRARACCWPTTRRPTWARGSARAGRAARTPLAVDLSEADARYLDATDPAPARRHDFLVPPAPGGRFPEAAYLAGNSLGLQPRAVRAILDEELAGVGGAGRRGPRRGRAAVEALPRVPA